MLLILNYVHWRCGGGGEDLYCAHFTYLQQAKIASSQEAEGRVGQLKLQLDALKKVKKGLERQVAEVLLCTVCLLRFDVLTLGLSVIV